MSGGPGGGSPGGGRNAEDWPRSGLLAAGRSWLRGLSSLVPEGRREEWRSEWEAELWQLWRRATRVPERYAGVVARGEGEGLLRLAAVMRYLAGAPFSVMHELKEEWMRDLWQDVRYGVRSLLRAPAFLVVAVLTLALGIGANTTVFSLVNALLFRAPPGIAAPGRLVRIGRGHAPRFDNWSIPVYRDLRAGEEGLAEVAGFASAGSVIVGRGQDAAAVPAQMVSDNYFDVLGVPPELGRTFASEEVTEAGSAPVAVISHALWRARFGGDSAAIGSTLAVNGLAFRIVGVAPAEFGGSDILRSRTDVWVPYTMVETMLGPGTGELLRRRSSSWFWVFARLAPGVSFEQASAATRSLYAHLDEEHPDLAGQGIWLSRGVGLTPEDRASVRPTSRLLMGVVFLVLLIACANLAGLALARGANRRGEVGVRTALGASRVRVARQFLTESVLLALVAGPAALGLTWLVAAELPALVPYPVSVGFDPDGRVLALGLALALAAGVLFGLAPALASARSDVRAALAGSSRAVVGRGGRFGRGLVAAQLALTFVLLAGTSVLLRSLWSARALDPGFDADHVAAVTLDVGMRGGYDAGAGRAFYRDLLSAARALPGVTAVGLASELPVADFQSNHTPLAPGEKTDRDAPPPAPVLSSPAGAGYFDAIGLPLVSGRTFVAGDYGEDAERVVVINQALAKRFFGDADPVGRVLPFAADPDWDAPTRVVGVAADSKNRSLRAPSWAQYWYPWGREYRGGMTLVARTAGDPRPLVAGLTELVQRIDPGMPVLRAAPLRELVGGTLRDTRMLSSLIAIFGALALVLAAVGLYGVMAYTVARRTREMGVRIAMGATRRVVLLMVLRQGLRLVVIGLALGIPLALAGLRLLESSLFQVSPADPLSLAAGAAVLVLVATAAAVIPARRATRVEPAAALREE